MDSIDRAILRIVQQDATVAVAELAERVGLSTTPCWRRLQLMEKRGIIKQRVTLVDAELVDLSMTAFVQVKAGKHDDKWLAMFATHAKNLEEVVEFYRMSGEFDYMLKVIVKDLKEFDVFYKKLVAGIDLSDVTSSFAMEQIKYTTVLPIR